MTLVPNTFHATSVQKIISTSNCSLCVDSTTIIPDIGVETAIRIYVQSLGPMKIQVRVLGQVKISKGKYPAPHSFQDPSKTMASFYRELFGDYLISTKNSVKDSQALGIKQSKTTIGSQILGEIMSQPQSFVQLILAFFFVMLFVNSLILFNLVSSLERSHSQIAVLREQIVSCRPYSSPF